MFAGIPGAAFFSARIRLPEWRGLAGKCAEEEEEEECRRRRLGFSRLLHTCMSCPKRVTLKQRCCSR